MPLLHVYRNGDRLQTIRFEKNVITLGRSVPSDVIFHDPTISQRHCTLSKKPSGWILEDNSKNGVIQGSGEPVIERVRVESSRRYHLGKVFAFEFEDIEPKNSKEATIIVSEKPTQLLKVDEKKGEITLGDAMLSVTLPDGRILQKNIEQPTLSIGSHTTNDFVIPSDAVSLFHARLDLIDQVYYYSDLGSTNGSKIEGVNIERASLPPTCEISLGSLRLQFTLKEEKIAITPKDCSEFLDMVGKTKAMQKIFSMIEIIGGTDAPVLVTGETGTGKELVARALHELSRRFHKPFIPLNCAALPKEMIESEVFGHEKGAFTGAISERPGAFEAADHGTLFLDEIGELDLDLQAKLLRVLESGEVKRLGSNKLRTVNVRLVTATHRNLHQDVIDGRFREDLYYRIHVAPIHLPSLRERRDDIELLVPFLLKRLQFQGVVSEEVMTSLKKYAFPGNVRELKNILQRAILEYQIQGGSSLRGLTRELHAKHFHFLKVGPTGPLGRAPRTPEEIREYNELAMALEASDYNQSEVARKLNLASSTVNDRIRKYGLNLKAKRH